MCDDPFESGQATIKKEEQRCGELNQTPLVAAEGLTLLWESMRASTTPSRMSWVTSSSRAATLVWNARAILVKSADAYGLKY